ncbi:11878_t:CDS:2, partial [Racocetra persica]
SLILALSSLFESVTITSSSSGSLLEVLDGLVELGLKKIS